MEVAHCFLSAVAVRKEPSHASEMVNQLLFGDTVEILERRPEWVLTRAFYDGYEGWVSDKQLQKEAATAPSTFIVPADNIAIVNGIRTIIPAGACCPADLLTLPVDMERKPVSTACRFLGSPYLWGGRTTMGIDCSGLVQVAYKVCGIELPREASQQAHCGSEVPLEEACAGDLAFFSNNEGRIVHVGIIAGDGTIIHASGMVRRDRIDSTGIFNEERGCYTHRLCFIRKIK